MQNDNKISISLTTALIIVFCIGALISGIICFFVFGNKSSNDETKLDISSLNTNSQADNFVSSSSSEKDNIESSTTQNTMSNTNSSTNTEDTNSSNISSRNTKTSSKTEPLSIGEWGIASKRSSGKYVDVPARVTNITRGTQAAQEFKMFCEGNSSIYRYEEPKEGTEWAIVEYEVDLTSFSSDVSISLDKAIIGTGDRKSIKYNNTIYIVSTANMSYDYASGKVVTAKFATNLPIGCSDYIITLGTDSETQAFVKGK